MDYLVFLIPLLPFLAAAFIGFGVLFNRISGKQDELITAKAAKSAISLSCLIAIGLLGADLSGINPNHVTLGKWLNSGSLAVEFNFITSGFSIIAAALFSIILLIIARFSTNYIHAEPGFHRFFFVLCLFSSAMLLLILSGNAIGTFIGWEIAGLCSYLLISFAYDRPTAVINATRVFVTNRIGDAGFILGIS